jgi:hypothetical protein
VALRNKGLMVRKRKKPRGAADLLGSAPVGTFVVRFRYQLMAAFRCARTSF